MENSCSCFFSLLRDIFLDLPDATAELDQVYISNIQFVILLSTLLSEKNIGIFPLFRDYLFMYTVIYVHLPSFYFDDFIIGIPKYSFCLKLLSGQSEFVIVLCLVQVCN